MGQKDLPSAGQPGWHPHAAQAQLLVHEVEVIVQALVSRCQFQGRIYRDSAKGPGIDAGDG
jgi:hypothetical protein